MMARLIVTPANQSEAYINKLLANPAIYLIEVQEFYVTWFMDRWLQVSRDHTGERPYDGVASARLTQQLRALGVSAGEKVLVALRPNVSYEFSIRMVSPITTTNQHLIGQKFETRKPEQMLLAG